MKKSASLPSIRINPELRTAAEGVLREGETLSGFILDSLCTNIERRKLQTSFLEKGLKALDESEATGEYYDADDVLAELKQMLVESKTGKKF
ncbi:YlcI/YnfO family protein [Pelodictyon luteolum]|uniref:Prevent-host-death protein n=1 Tax=Chlorobium luteolum (strain DSM 273 / BCRC 81028 / 2530) TaxID=319225 RepID=Q3B3Z3_CHLL3|nr:YlcI/YnfO family protein [Pelodictyon luteolum]ABB23938.1 conserved hypothetical protein [Pelodictyon luteolum DSM 273]